LFSKIKQGLEINKNSSKRINKENIFFQKNSKMKKPFKISNQKSLSPQSENTSRNAYLYSTLPLDKYYCKEHLKIQESSPSNLKSKKKIVFANANLEKVDSGSPKAKNIILKYI